MPENVQPLYDLFISYRRKDGSRLAHSLRLRLQSFQLSNDVINRLPTADQTDARRRLRVYLDVAYERAASDFFDKKIIPALDASRRLAVICTPAAFDTIMLTSGETAPNWLCREIEHFLQSREAAWESMFVVLGPGASENRFPGRLNEYSRWDWVDFREFKRSHWLSDANDAGLAKLIAGIYNLPDELLPVLRGEERKRRFRRLTLAVVVATLVATLTTGLAIAALRASRLAANRLAQVLVQQSHSLAALAELRSAQGDNTLATLLSLRALPPTDGSSQRPISAVAEVSLYRALVSSREKHVISVSPCTAATIAVSDSGQRFATGCFAGNRPTKVFVFDTNTGRRVSSLDAGSSRVDYVTFLSGDRLLATGSSDGTIVLWDTVTGARLRNLRQDGLNAFARDRLGRRLITATSGSTAIIWDLTNGVQLLKLLHPGAKILDASFSEAGARVLTASNKGEVTVWDSVTGRTLQILRQSSVKHALFFGNDQKIMASGGNDATLWRRRGGRFIKTARLIGHVNAVNSIAASPNGRVVATCSFDGTARVWDAGTGKLLSLLSTGESNTCFATTFSPDSTMLATVDDRKARVWRVPDGWPLMSLQSHTRPVTRLSFTPDGTRLITSTNGETVSIWDVKREPNLVASFAAENIADVEWNDQIEHLFIVDGKGHVTSMANDGASSDVQTLGHDGMTRLYFITSSRQWLQFTKSAGLRLVPESGKGPVQQLTHAGQPILHIAVNRAAGVVAASDQARVLNWRLSRDSTRPRVLNLEIGQITSMNINSSGTLLAAASKNYVTIWDLRTSMRRWMLSRHQGETEEAEVLRFSPDGRWLLSSTDDTVTLWDLAEGRKHCAADIDSPIMDATFSPDGNTFAIGTEEATFALYDSSRCTALRTLDRPDTFALDATVAFTRSGRRLLTAASDGFAELWDVETGARLQTFDNTVARDDGLPSQEENDLCFAQFNAHEDRVVLASDHNVTIWSVLPEGEALIQRAKQLVPRDFLPEELIEYGLGPSPSK